MVNGFRRARWLAVTLFFGMLMACTERMDLAPVHIGHQDIHALLPDYPDLPPVTHGHVPGAMAPALSPEPFATDSTPSEPLAEDATPAEPFATPQPAPPIVNAKAQNATHVKHVATIASNQVDKKSIIFDVASEKPIPEASTTPSKPTSPRTHTAKTKLDFAWPLTGRITKNYRQTGKKGIKIAVRKEQTVHAAEAGQVVYCGQGLIGYGNLLIIKHNSQYLTAYANNSALLAKEGDIVEKGQRIATVGAGPSEKGLLHFEIRKHGKAVNPLALLPKLQ